MLGDTVNVGDLLIEFDIEKIKKAGYEVVTPVIITNHNSFESLEVTEQKTVELDENLMKIKA
nr:PTS glucose transporter subunit IIA [Sporosalibacterium faouarense]